ncbi:MAG: hypothetical protein ACXVPN_00465 [Bacteroidia bacterium]
MERDPLLNIFFTFLGSIGIETIEKDFEEKSFLAGLKIENGKLIVCRQKLLYPGDILHEAGHIAVTPGIERRKLNDNVVTNRPGSEGEEMAAMLWSYAACIHLKIDPGIVFHKDGYKGSSEWILDNYRNRNFIGLPLLKWMGLASQKEEAGFPKMLKWLRD